MKKQGELCWLFGPSQHNNDLISCQFPCLFLKQCKVQQLTSWLLMVGASLQIILFFSRESWMYGESLIIKLNFCHLYLLITIAIKFHRRILKITTCSIKLFYILLTDFLLLHIVADLKNTIKETKSICGKL